VEEKWYETILEKEKTGETIKKRGKKILGEIVGEKKT
jgi:hypothetical protein